jgi:predicted phosphohydrolase
MEGLLRRLYFVSDTHHELMKEKASRELNIVPTASSSNVKNYLALCGDIGNPFNANYVEFIQRHSERFERVFIVAGNHEYYSNQKQRTMIETDAKITEVASQFPNVTFLQQSSFQVEDTLFMGCTLWTAVDEQSEGSMNDYNRIYVDSDAEAAKFIYYNTNPIIGKTKKKYVRAGRKLLKYRDILQLHEEMKEWLDQTINTPVIQKMIVLTHHAPSAKMLKLGVANNCYASECDDLFKPPVVCWISGHTHECISVEINGIPSMSNCFGYPGQKTGVDLNKYFEF